MDTQTTSSPTPPSAQVIGNAFVEQYYHILHHSPELVHRFYQESSVLSRPEPNGVMTSVTTTEGIDDKICSFNYKNYKAEIKTADAQESYKDGVIVLVTGCLTGMDDIRRKFTQTFFLAPQDKGYFVLNDVFRYVEDSEPLESNKVIVNGIHDAPLASITPDPEPVHVYDPPEVDSTTSLVEEVQVQHVEEKPCDPVDNETQLVNEEEVVVEHEPQSDENHVLAVTESASYTAQEDAPKKSYAYILSSQTKKAGSGPAKVYVQANTSRVGPTKTEKRTPVPVAHDPVTEPSAPSASGSVNAPQSGNAQEEAEGHSIYVRNLPLNVTDSQLEEEFTKFGPIKQGGVQVRSNKDFCFGFVEFQSFSSMNNAIQASPITIGDKQAVVEIKRTTTRGNGRERFSSGRGGFRSDSFRGRRNFVSGRGYGRSEVGNLGGDFSGRGRGPGGRSGDGNQQGRGRGGRRGVSNWNPISA
ncbi:nuclear transport factor 2-like isoform X2 [Rhododendron vialii]|uniref:nuclear transport factor 2-like isoform X2 n=1 Tax=Rhododendron vialii TaxID=182163 RepID=UPI00265FA7AB|nr:nuclear transport factor 2-like isoform X2 [Rhododendron vialii]